MKDYYINNPEKRDIKRKANAWKPKYSYHVDDTETHKASSLRKLSEEVGVSESTINRIYRGTGDQKKYSNVKIVKLF